MTPLEVTTSLSRQLYDVGAIKFGEFKLKAGQISPIYFDLRVIISHPSVLKSLGELMVSLVNKQFEAQRFDHLCGVPYAALPLCSVMSMLSGRSMVMKRKELKAHGTGQNVEGDWKCGQSCLIVEDVVTTGSSIIETVQTLRDARLEVAGAVVLLDREQGGIEKLRAQGIAVFAAFGARELLEALRGGAGIEDAHLNDALRFLSASTPLAGAATAVTPVPSASAIAKPERPFPQRVPLCANPVTKHLLELMARKRTNLCIAADFHSATEVLELADAIGPEIAVLKTHADIISDFNGEFTQKLKSLATKHEFLILEDRKFTDIGKIVVNQLECKLFRYCDWADLVTVQGISGPGVLKAFSSASASARCPSALLIAEMSSEGNLITPEYTRRCAALAAEFSDVVAGFICQHRVQLSATATAASEERSQGFLHFTPGVHMFASGDKMGQQYRSPEKAISEQLCDVVIVGSGVIENPPSGIDEECRARGISTEGVARAGRFAGWLLPARLYRHVAFQAYEKRLTHSAL